MTQPEGGPFLSRLPLDIRLTVDTMRHQIIKHVGNHLNETEQFVAEQVNAAINSFDFAGEIRKIAEQITGNMIRQTVAMAVKERLQSAEMVIAVQDAAEQALREHFEKRHFTP